MGQKKLHRFEAIKSFPNVLEYPTDMKGKWNRFFNNDHLLNLELACGKGEYTLGLARLYPQQNFIGIDIKGNRIYVGAKLSMEEKVNNTAFLRTQIQKLPEYFNPGEVSEIWITFPDPQLRTSRAKNRLTHPRFLRLYQQVIKPGGYIHLKTDSTALYHFTRYVANMYKIPIVEDIADVIAQPNISKELKITTHYEKLDIEKSNKIYYLKFTIPALLPDIDHQLYEELKRIETLI